MDNREARDLLAQKLAAYRRLSYAELAAKVGGEEHAEAIGSSGARYQIEVQLFWGGTRGPVRVVGSIDDGGLRAFYPLTETFIRAPDGTFVGETPV
jgi:hypothetical protein